MEATANLKDFWGNNAIDYGTINEMTDKYADNIFVFVTDRPFGEGYVLLICDESEEEMANKWVKDYRASMRARGVVACGVGVCWGCNVNSARMQGFLGGVRI